jgi:hypothetical protein
MKLDCATMNLTSSGKDPFHIFFLLRCRVADPQASTCQKEHRHLTLYTVQGAENQLHLFFSIGSPNDDSEECHVIHVRERVRCSQRILVKSFSRSRDFMSDAANYIDSIA